MKKLTLNALSVTLAGGVVLALLSHSPVARADDIPNNTFRAGMYAVFYHVKAQDLSGPFVPTGVNLDVKNTQTAYFGYIRRLSSWFDVELAFGIPPDTKTVGRGPAALGSVPYN